MVPEHGRKKMRVTRINHTESLQYSVLFLRVSAPELSIISKQLVPPVSLQGRAIRFYLFDLSRKLSLSREPRESDC
jgi:hypothetical protein